MYTICGNCLLMARPLMKCRDPCSIRPTCLHCYLHHGMYAPKESIPTIPGPRGGGGHVHARRKLCFGSSCRPPAAAAAKKAAGRPQPRVVKPRAGKWKEDLICVWRKRLERGDETSYLYLAANCSIEGRN